MILCNTGLSYGPAVHCQQQVLAVQDCMQKCKGLLEAWRNKAGFAEGMLPQVLSAAASAADAKAAASIWPVCISTQCGAAGRAQKRHTL